MKHIQLPSFARQIDSLFDSRIVELGVRYEIWLPHWDSKLDHQALREATTDPAITD